jgi:hypothetical protein
MLNDLNKNYPKKTSNNMRKIITISAVILSMVFINSCKKNTNPNITDADGNVYTSVSIGTQIWLKENLRATRYNNGESIPLVIDFGNWASLTTPGYCWYNNDSPSSKKHMEHCTIGIQ